MKRKKVLYIITKAVWGGAQRYVYDLATNLPSDFEAVVAAGGDGILFKRLALAGIRTLTIPAMQRDVHTTSELKAFWHLLQLFLKEEPDIIHFNSSKAGALGAPAAYLYKLLKWNFKPRVIFTVHGWGFKEDRPRHQKGLIFVASWFASLFYNSVILINQNDFQSAEKFIPARKLVLIRNGIVKPTFLSRNKVRTFFDDALSIPQDGFVVGTIAELTKNKGLIFFLSSLEKLMRSFPKLHAIIIGDGEERDYMQTHIEKRGLANRIHLLGFVPNASSLLQGFDAFILPSLKEGLPYVLLEALAAGVPAIATRVGGIPDIIHHDTNGVLVPAKDVISLEGALKTILIDTKLREKLSKNALQTFEENFTLPLMIKPTIEQVYER